MTQWEYWTMWWTGSETTVAGKGQLSPPGAPMGPEQYEQFNARGTDGWELVGITAAPIQSGWLNPVGAFGIVPFTSHVQYVATFKRALEAD